MRRRVPGKIGQVCRPTGIKLIYTKWNLKWSQDSTNSGMASIDKKGCTKKCKIYRTIALIFYVSKVMLNVLNQRHKYFPSWKISKMQALSQTNRLKEQILDCQLKSVTIGAQIKRLIKEMLLKGEALKPAKLEKARGKVVFFLLFF